MTRTVHLAGTRLELVERGQGRPLLFLHAGEGLAPERPWLDLLSRHYRVIAPWHPGYGGSPLIDAGYDTPIDGWGTAPEDPQTLLIREQDARLVHEALAQLPVEFREVLILRELEDLSYR